MASPRWESTLSLKQAERIAFLLKGKLLKQRRILNLIFWYMNPFSKGAAFNKGSKFFLSRKCASLKQKKLLPHGYVLLLKERIS